jgi:hypothetical protein
MVLERWGANVWVSNSISSGVRTALSVQSQVLIPFILIAARRAAQRR